MIWAVFFVGMLGAAIGTKVGFHFIVERSFLTNIIELKNAQIEEKEATIKIRELLITNIERIEENLEALQAEITTLKEELCRPTQ